MIIYYYHLYNSKKIDNLNLENVIEIIELKKYLSLKDYINYIHHIVYENQSKPILIMTSYHKNYNFHLLSYNQISKDDIIYHYKFLTDEDYDFDKFILRYNSGKFKPHEVIQIDYNNFVYKNYKIYTNVYEKNFYIEHRLDIIKLASKWYVSKDNRTEYILSIYTDYTTNNYKEMDIAVFNKNYNQEYYKVLEKVFDYLRLYQHEFWIDYVYHTKKIIK